jgi:hypothetical protein
MKHFKNPQAIEFDFLGKTYRVVPSYRSGSCEWWQVGSHTKYRCDLDDPAYQILTPEEDWMTSMSLYMMLDSEDMFEQGQFLEQLNKAVRYFLPKGHPKWCKERSTLYQESLKM